MEIQLLKVRIILFHAAVKIHHKIVYFRRIDVKLSSIKADVLEGSYFPNLNIKSPPNPGFYNVHEPA